jgi:hypothetical protein
MVSQVPSQSFLMAEGSGSLDRVIVDGDRVTVETLRDRLREPTAVAKVGGHGLGRGRPTVASLRRERQWSAAPSGFQSLTIAPADGS